MDTLQMKKLFFLFLALILALSFLYVISEEVEAQSPRQTRVEREIRAVRQTIGVLENHLKWLESIACGSGLQEYCEKEEALSSSLRVQTISSGGGTLLGIYRITRYYSPIPNQERYLYEFKNRDKGCVPGNMRWLGYRSRVKGEYAADLCVNSSGSAFKTADGTDLRLKTPFRVAACPREMAFGTRLVIEGIGNVTCHDRGGAIRGKRLDVWAGIGTQAILDMQNSPAGRLNVYSF